jgi:uncharacterized protein
MDYEFDDAKNRANRAKHGIDFDFAARVFDSAYIERLDNRYPYGEERVVAIGPIEGVLFTVVYTQRGERRRIISARKATRRERDAYRDTVA